MKQHLYLPNAVPWDDGRCATYCGLLVDQEKNAAAESPCRRCLELAGEAAYRNEIAREAAAR